MRSAGRAVALTVYLEDCNFPVVTLSGGMDEESATEIYQVLKNSIKYCALCKDGEFVRSLGVAGDQNQVLDNSEVRSLDLLLEFHALYH